MPTDSLFMVIPLTLRRIGDVGRVAGNTRRGEPSGDAKIGGRTEVTAGRTLSAKIMSFLKQAKAFFSPS